MRWSVTRSSGDRSTKITLYSLIEFETGDVPESPGGLASWRRQRGALYRVPYLNENSFTRYELPVDSDAFGPLLMRFCVRKPSIAFCVSQLPTFNRFISPRVSDFASASPLLLCPLLAGGGGVRLLNIARHGRRWFPAISSGHRRSCGQAGARR